MTAVTPTQAARLIAKAKRTALEDKLLADLAKLGLPAPEREYGFHPVRKWRFDMAYPSRSIAIECDGEPRQDTDFVRKERPRNVA